MHSVLLPPPRLGPIKSPLLFELPSLFQTRIINSFMMKFLALALAFLMAAGCQADAPPNTYEHARAAVVTFLTQAKVSAEKVIDHLDDAEFKDLKPRLHQGLQNIETYMTSAAEQLAPVRSGLGPQIAEFIFGARDKVKHDMEELRKELEPKCAELRQVVRKHLDEYRTLLNPVLQDYSEKQKQVVEEFKAKFEPVVKQLHEKFKVNVEETKSKLTPIVEIIRNHLTKILEEWKATYGPLVEEYREKIEKTASELRTMYESGKLQENLKTMGEELRPQIVGIYHTIEKAFQA
ncbi:uncharacterized protein Hap1MRO34_000533 [Clarias gariepinus]